MGETVGKLKVGDVFRKWDGRVHQVVEKSDSRVKIKPPGDKVYEVAHGTEVLEILAPEAMKERIVMEKQDSDKSVNNNVRNEKKENVVMETKESTKKSAKAKKASAEIAKREVKKAEPKTAKREGNVAKKKAKVAKQGKASGVSYILPPSDGSKRSDPKPGSEFVVTFKGKEYKLKVVKDGDGRIVYKVGNTTFLSPSAAGKSVTQNQVNGWKFWKIA